MVQLCTDEEFEREVAALKAGIRKVLLGQGQGAGVVALIDLLRELLRQIEADKRQRLAWLLVEGITTLMTAGDE